ncbi:MAG: lysophospholipid acyltransferase family protein [Myxococcota bacterium]
MIKDAKGGLFARVLDWYFGRKVRGAFRGVWVRGEVPSADGGLLVYLNHSSFWDGFVVHQLGKAAGWDTYALMEEENLAKYRFHTRLGAFSVRRGDRRSALESVRYAAEDVLRRKNAALCVFPEGELVPGGGPPRAFKRGVEVIARRAQVRCLPVAVRYAFLEHERPDLLLEVGEPHGPAELPHFHAALTAACARLAEVRSTDGFRCLVRGRRGAKERWDAVRGLPAVEAPALAPSTPADPT